MDASLAGRLLVAAPLLLDPNFLRAVVLILHHDEHGAMGLILNRRSEEPAEPYLADWGEFLETDGLVFDGGPVERERALGLAAPVDLSNPSTGLTDFSASPGPPAPIRIFAGYAGWAAGQLEFEIEQRSWLVLPAEPDDFLTSDPDRLWSRVLARQGGTVAMLAHYPMDPSLN
ncbi:MAG: YqgE/AlgH family protein [Actinobacteria bacterium]|nr:YqgE/AlgH family protein [Actinomycetota bacterium]